MGRWTEVRIATQRSHLTQEEAASAQFVLLVDHDNIPLSDMPLDRIVTRWVQSIGADHTLPAVISVHIRAYGGWFSEERATQARYRAVEYYQEFCPALFRLDKHFCRLSFQFADFLANPSSLLSSGDTRISHTMAERSSVPRCKPRKNADPCDQQDCELAGVRKWLKGKHACTRNACPRSFGEHFVRLEQKQVDVHLAVDLIRCSNGKPAIFLGIASDDADLLPAVASTAATRPQTCDLSLLRFSSRPRYLDAFILQSGGRILTLGEEAE